LEPLEIIESQDDIWLVGLSEPWDNSLTITVAPSSRGELQEGIPFVDGWTLPPGRLLTPDKFVKIDISFDFYFFYRIYNETYSRPHQNAKYEGKLFRTYQESEFIIRLDKNGEKIQEQDLNKHYQIVCMHHTIDIVSWSQPEFTFRSSST